MIGVQAIGLAPMGTGALSLTSGTPPAVGDGVPPTFTGSLQYSSTSNSITIEWSGAISTDNVAIARREYRIGGTGAYTPATPAEEVSKTHTFPALAASTPYQIDVRCVDTNGNASEPLTIGVTTSTATGEALPGTNYIPGKLATHEGVLHSSLAVLEWSLFSQASPRHFSAPVAQGTHTMTAGSADLKIAVPAGTVPTGWYWLVLADTDGTTAVAARILVGP